MPDIGFYDNNQYIAYPFKTDESFEVTDSSSSLSSMVCGSTVVPLKGIVDGGFILGLDSEFEDAVHTVYLQEVTINGTTADLDFRSDAPGMADYRWLFTFDSSCGFGTTVQVDATNMITYDAAPDRGTGFLTLGDLSELFALGDGTYSLCAQPEIEPALLHNLGKSFVRSVSIANTERLCPEECCASSSLTPDSNVYVYATGLQGNVRLREGYNIKLEINPSRNQLEIIAQLNAGEGPNCDDVIIDSDGPDGFRHGGSSLCSTCDDYVRSVNGLTAPSGVLTLVGSSGIRIVSDPVNNKIIVDAKQIRACQLNG